MAQAITQAVHYGDSAARAAYVPVNDNRVHIWIEANGDQYSWVGATWLQTHALGLPIFAIGTLQSGDDETHNVKVVETGQFTGGYTVAASQTNNTAGAAGDFLHKITMIVSTAATSTVAITLNGSAFTLLPANTPIGIYTFEPNEKLTGALIITTGAGVACRVSARIAA